MPFHGKSSVSSELCAAVNASQRPSDENTGTDALSGAGLITAAMLLDDETPQNRAILAGIGALEIAVASVSSTEAYAEDAAPNAIEHTAARVAEYVG